MRLPVPTAREIRWGFYLVAVCAIVLTLTLCWAVVQRINESDDIVRIAATSSAQVDRLSNQVDAQAKLSAEQRAQLQAQNAQLHAELAALLKYLRGHGIAVPQVALPRREPGGGTVTRPKASSTPSEASSPPSPRPSSRPDTPEPTPTPAPSPTGGATADVCALLPLTCPLF